MYCSAIIYFYKFDRKGFILRVHVVCVVHLVEKSSLGKFNCHHEGQTSVTCGHWFLLSTHKVYLAMYRNVEKEESTATRLILICANKNPKNS